MAETQTCSPVARDYLRLHLGGLIGPITFDRLMEHFGSLDAVLGASAGQLSQTKGVGEKTAASIRSAAGSDVVEKEIALAERLGVRIVCREDADYPEPLRHIPDPPICLYTLGGWRREDALSLAIVGTRNPSYYGVEQAERFATMLSQVGLTIVSGMARGIDQSAHWAALRARGRTIAVLGCGLANCYPPESVQLRDKIAASGAVISELPLEIAPDAKNFPRRNRIIAGLSLGTLVIEAGHRSGALITARLATEYNREVFATPGRVDSLQAKGANALIRDGQAKLAVEVGDILDELGEAGVILAKHVTDQAEAREQDEAERIAATAEHKLPESQRVVYAALDVEPTHMERIAKSCGLPIGDVAAALTMLQITGLVKQMPGNTFARRASG